MAARAEHTTITPSSSARLLFGRLVARIDRRAEHELSFASALEFSKDIVREGNRSAGRDLSELINEGWVSTTEEGGVRVELYPAAR